MNNCFKYFVCNRLSGLSVIRSQKLCLSSINYSFVNKNKEQKNSKKLFYKIRTEELIGFDSQFGDIFGTLASNDYRNTRLKSEDLPEDDDNYDVLEIKRGPKMAEIGYKKQLNKLINRKPIQMRKALELYNKMVSEDRIPPHKCTYSLMINGCAKVGFTLKAFELFEEMLKYGLRPTKQTITSLFNACAECPFPDFGLQKARYLREWMSLEAFIINTFHYNSMIKAFGKLGDIQTAFQLVDEMVANGQTADEQTFSMLLIGCISNKESGLFNAIRIFRRMIVHRIPIYVHIFNLLLKATKECGIGSESDLNSIIGKPICNSKSNSSGSTSKALNIKSDVRTTKMDTPLSGENDSKSLVTKTPNFVINKSHNQLNIIEINYDLMSKPSNRFFLFGGIEGFIQMMTDFNVTPDIKTLTLITELTDFNERSEKEILDLLDKFKIRTDTDFFNILIKRMCFQKGLLSAKKVLKIMTEKGLQPNIMTFGVLSLGCNQLSFGRQLLTDMEEINIKPNIQIMGALMSNACQTNNFYYINYLINYMKENDIKPDQIVIEKLEIIRTRFQKIFSDYDWNQNNNISQKKFLNKEFRKEFDSFKSKFEEWIKCETIQEEEHPWHQFQFDEIPNKKGMHSFVKFMKRKIQTRRGKSGERLIHEFEEDDLHND